MQLDPKTVKKVPKLRKEANEDMKKHGNKVEKEKLISVMEVRGNELVFSCLFSHFY